MRKRVLSVLLVITLLIAVGIVAAQADPEYTPDQIVTLSAAQTFTGTEPVTAPCYACGGEEKVWQPLTAITDGSTTTMTEDHYFVAEDITHGKLQATAGKNICLHLNGKNVTYGAYGSAIVGSSGTLNIMGNTTIWGGATNLGVVDIDSTGTINIYGAKLRGHAAATFAAQSQGGTINFYDVDVLVGMIRVYSYNKPSSLNFYSGDYTAASGLSVLCNAAWNNDAAVAFHGGQFGTVTMDRNITITGGTIASLVAGENTTAINVSGNPVINSLDLTASPVKLTVGELTSGASINLGTTTGVFTEPFATPEAAEAAKGYFVAPGKTLSVTGDKALSCEEKTYTPANTIEEKIEKSNAQRFEGTEAVVDYCYVCNKEVTWQPITAAQGITTDGHYFLTQDISGGVGHALYMWGATTACVHQNGKTITSGNISTINNFNTGTTLTLMGGGRIENASAKGTLYTGDGMTLNVYGATVHNTAMYQYCTELAGGVMNLCGVDASGSGVVANAAAGELNIHSGSFNKINVTTGQISLSGAPTVNAVDMSAATTKINAKGLTGGSINVSTVDGVFTTPFDSDTLAKAAIPFFVAGGNKAVTVADGNVLSCGVKTYTPANTIEEKIEKSNAQSFEGTDPVADYCYVCNKEVTWQPITAATHIAATGHYFLANDITATDDNALYIWGDGVTACVHQNGKTIMQPSNRNQQAIAGLKADGILNLMGGGLIQSTSSNGTIHCQAGAINVYGSTIKNLGGHQYCTTVTAGTVSLYGVDASGSGVVADAAAGELNIHSGSFNKINITGGQVSLSGAPTVNAVDMSAATTKINAKGLTGGSINVSAVDGVFTTPFDSDALAKAAIPFFVGGSKTISATDEYALKCEVKTYTPANTIAEKIAAANKQTTDGLFGTEAVEDYCYVCNQPVTWQPITTATNIYNGHYFLANDITRGGGQESALYTWGTAGTVCLHLNGKTVTHTGSLAAIESMDARTSVFNVMGGGRLENMSSSYGALTSTANSTLNVYGGTVENGAGRQYCTTITNGTVNLYNVEASTNEVSATAGTINIESGSFRAITITAGQVNLSGTPVVGTLDASAATVLPDLTGVTGGEINIGATEGVFTTAFATPEAAAAVAKFVYAPEKIIVVDGDALSTADAAAAVVNGNDQKAYATYAAAEAAYTDGYIKLLADDNIEITENVTIDFNGQSVEVAGSSELTGFDSTTQGRFYVEPASVKIANTITIAVPEATEVETLTKGYLAVTDDYGITTFSYYEMKLSGVALKANKDTVGLYYKGTWNFNDYLPAGKVEAGVVVNVQDQNDTPFANGFRSNNANGYYSAPAENIANGEPVTSVLVNDIMKADRNDAALNSQYGQMKIKAAAFITVNGQDIITGIKNLSVCDVLKLIEGNDAAYAANETKLANFYETWKTLANLDTWGLTKIGK